MAQALKLMQRQAKLSNSRKAGCPVHGVVPKVAPLPMRAPGRQTIMAAPVQAAAPATLTVESTETEQIDLNHRFVQALSLLGAGREGTTCHGVLNATIERSECWSNKPAWR